MNPKNKIINKFYPDNQVISEWDIDKQLFYIKIWDARANKNVYPIDPDYLTENDLWHCDNK